MRQRYAHAMEDVEMFDEALLSQHDALPADTRARLPARRCFRAPREESPAPRRRRTRWRSRTKNDDIFHARSSIRCCCGVLNVARY